jgi:hypothetical protein
MFEGNHSHRFLVRAISGYTYIQVKVKGKVEEYHLLGYDAV